MLVTHTPEQTTERSGFRVVGTLLADAGQLLLIIFGLPIAILVVGSPIALLVGLVIAIVAKI